MVDVFSLLTLPGSTAFSKFKVSDFAPSEALRSESPPHKVPRLEADSDVASASRLAATGNEGHNESQGVTHIRLGGKPIQPHPESFYDQDFVLLRRSIKLILTKGNTSRLPASYAKIYSACRSVVLAAHKGEGLYDYLKLNLEQCIGSLVMALINEEKEEMDWIVPFVELSVWYEKQVALLESLLVYLDRAYVVDHKALLSIRSLAYVRFAECILQNAQIVDKLRDGIRAWVEWERDHRQDHAIRPHIPELIRRLENHGRYNDLFVEYFLKVTHEYYAAESERKRSEPTASAHEFLIHCIQRIREEEERAKMTLPSQSFELVINTVDRALWTGRHEWIATSALQALIDDAHHQDLTKLYNIFKQTGGLKVLAAAFKLYVQERVQAIVKDTEHEDTMVDRLLEFKKTCDQVVTGDFIIVTRVVPITPVDHARPSTSVQTLDANTKPEPSKVPNQDFVYALTDAFSLGFKARRNKPAELIAKYLDKAMRKGQRGKRDEEFQAELDAALGLYRFTDDKDVFRTFYHRALAKRLLLEKSASDDFEKAMLKKLKENYDPEFGMGDHMFNDLTLSRDLMLEFNERYGDKTSRKLSVMVLQRSFWPFTAQNRNPILPEDMQEELRVYEKFYGVAPKSDREAGEGGGTKRNSQGKYQGRKLDWDHGLGTAALRARFKAGDKDLSVSLYQAIILLLFNEESELPFSFIKDRTGIEDAELRRTLQSLALGKKRVLKKHPPGRDVNDGDTFHYNADFADPAHRIHINSIQVKETAEESQRTQTLIEGDRKYALDAAIVRIMKGKKELPYSELLNATVAAVKNHFAPEVADIKQRIESLVEQDYLKRHDEKRNVYVYVA